MKHFKHSIHNDSYVHHSTSQHECEGFLTLVIHTRLTWEILETGSCLGLSALFTWMSMLYLFNQKRTQDSPYLVCFNQVSKNLVNHWFKSLVLDVNSYQVKLQVQMVVQSNQQI